MVAQNCFAIGEPALGVGLAESGIIHAIQIVKLVARRHHIQDLNIPC
jgi:hypothetical protein